MGGIEKMNIVLRVGPSRQPIDGGEFGNLESIQNLNKSLLCNQFRPEPFLTLSNDMEENLANLKFLNSLHLIIQGMGKHSYRKNWFSNHGIREISFLPMV